MMNEVLTFIHSLAVNTNSYKNTHREYESFNVFTTIYECLKSFIHSSSYQNHKQICSGSMFRGLADFKSLPPPHTPHLHSPESYFLNTFYEIRYFVFCNLKF